MRPTLVLVILASSGFSLGCAGSRAPAGADSGDARIFREITVDPFPAIRLGAAFPAHSISKRLNDSTYQLQPDGFGGTRQLIIHVDGGGIVTGMSFLYGEDETYEAKVADYTARLGTPVARSAPGDSIWTRWEDGGTRFEVSKVRRGELVTQRSRLWDLPR